MKRTKKGFTLVELLVVIAIIAIIAAVAVPVTISQIEKANISTAKNEAANGISAVQNAAAVIGTEGKDFSAATLVAELTKSFSDPKQIVAMQIKPEGTSGFTIAVITSTDFKADDTSIVKATAKAAQTLNGTSIANAKDLLAVKQVLKGISVSAASEDAGVVEAVTASEEFMVTWDGSKWISKKVAAAVGFTIA